MKKLFSFLAIGILCLMFAGCGHRVSVKKIQQADLQTKSYMAGNFKIVWDAADGGTLKVSHWANPEKILWSSIPGKGFIAAGKGKSNDEHGLYEESRGSFFIEDKVKLVCSNQTVDTIKIVNDEVVILGKLTRGNKESVGYSLTFKAKNDNQLGFQVQFDDNSFNRTYLNYATNKDEHFFGFGEQFTYFDIKGKRLPIFVMEQGIGRGSQPFTFLVDMAAKAGGDWHTSYAGVPQYITSQVRSMFLENNEYSVFDLTKDDEVQVQVFASQMTGNILYGETPADLIAEYTLHAGRMRKLPDWILDGAIIGMQGGTDKVRRIHNALKEADTPIAAFWLQDWVGQRTTSFGKQLWWNWVLDEGHYPGWNELVAELEKDGVKTLTYINPFLVDVSEREGNFRNLFKEAKENDYLVKNKDGTPYMILNTSFSAGLIDLTNPKAWEWTKDVIKKEVIGAGSVGWMADFGEALPMDTTVASGESTETYHNRYPEEWARLNREAIDEMPNRDDFVFFSRSGYKKSPGYSTLFWLGDQLVTWDKYDGIKTAVTGLLSSGLSGYSFNHSDIGGYTTITNPIMDRHRSRELNLRWIELNAFTTIFRSHEGNRPAANHQVYDDKEAIAHFARFAKIYRAWGDYRKELVAEASKTGLPVVRHPFIHYPDDANVYDMSYQQFMIGSEFKVVPVLDPKTDTVDAYLPAGSWVHLWSGKEYAAPAEGLTVSVAAPLGQPGVFYKKGSKAAATFINNLKAEKILK